MPRTKRVPMDAEPQDMPTARANLAVSSLADGRQAYYQGDYEAAIAHFDSVMNNDDYDEDSRVVAAYWHAEAALKLEFSEKNIARFEEIADDYYGHYLATAAERRGVSLRRYFATIQGE